MNSSTTGLDVAMEIVKVVGSLAATLGVPYMAWRLQQVEKNTNSKMDKVLAQTMALGEQKGRQDAQEAQKAQERSK
jgi:hypothetical protein